MGCLIRRPGAITLAAFVGSYGAARIFVDFAYSDDRDWPRGRAFAVGPIQVTTLFVFLSAPYPGLFLWRV
jgi:hypothetical protein